MVNLSGLGTGGNSMPLVMLAINRDNQSGELYLLARSFGRVRQVYRGTQKQDGPLWSKLCKLL